MKNKKKVLIILFIAVSLLLLFISFRFVSHIIIFNEHKKYSELPIEEQTIKRWMSLKYIEDVFWIDFKKEFWHSPMELKRNSRLGDYCEKYKLNCDEVRIKLDILKNGN